MKFNFKIILVFSYLLLIAISCKNDSFSANPSEPLTEKEAYFEDFKEQKMKFGYINSQGQLAIRDEYDGVRDFSEGLAAVNKKGSWGYINTIGSTVIDFQFRSAFPFQNGIAKVQDYDKSYFFIDKTGTQISQLRFEQAGNLKDDLIKIQTTKGYNFVNLQGDTLLDESVVTAKDFNNGVSKIKYLNQKYGLINTAGKVIIPYEYEQISEEENGLFRVKRDGKYGIIDKNGKVILAPIHSHMSHFQNDFFVTKTEGTFEIRNTKNQLIHSLQNIESIEPMGMDTWRVFKNDKFGIINSDNESIAPYKYDELFNLEDGMIAYRIDDKWGYMSDKGAQVIKAQFPLVWSYHNGFARVVTEGGIGFLNKEGTLSIPPIFFEVKDFHDGLARVQIYRG